LFFLVHETIIDILFYCAPPNAIVEDSVEASLSIIITAQRLCDTQ